MEEKHDLILFNQLFSEYRDRFVRFAYSYTSDYMAAEDIVMEAMMYYWTNRTKLNTTNPPAYLLTSIKNRALNYLRDQQLHLSTIDTLKDISEWKLNTQISSLEACNPTELFSQEILDKMNEAIAQMSKTTKRVFVMRRFEDKTYKEIADELGITTKGVEYHLTKANEYLKKYLKDYIALIFILLHV